MKKISKVSAISAASFLIAGTTAFTAFAAMPSGTVVIGSKAYSLKYANDPSHVDEITDAVVAANNKVYVKDFSGDWVNNDAATTAIGDVAGTIPAVTYTDGSVTQSYTSGDVGPTTTPTTPTNVSGTVTATTSMAAGRSVGQSEALVDVGTITLNGTGTLTGVSVTRQGLSSDNTLKNVSVWDGANRISMSTIFSKSQAQVNFLKPLVVSGAKTLSVKVNMDPDNATGSSQFLITLNSLNAADGTTVSGFTPASSGTFTVADISDMGELQVKASGDSPTGYVDAGTQGITVAKYDFNAMREDEILKSVTFTLNGSIGSSDIGNFKLYNDGTQVGSTVAALTDNKVTFVFDKGVSLPKGSTIKLELKGDIFAGSTSASGVSNKTIQFDIDEDTDVMATGLTYNTAIVADTDGTISGTQITVNPGKFIISKDQSSPAAGNIGKTFKQTKFSSVALQAMGESLQVQKLRVEIKSDGNHGEDVKKDLANLKIMANGSTVYQESDNKFDYVTGTKDAVEYISLTNPVTIDAGKSTVFDFYADTADSVNNAGGLTADEEYQIGIAASDISVHAVGATSGQTRDTKLTSPIFGNPMTVGDVDVKATQVPTGNTKIFDSSSSNKLAAFILKQNLTEDVSLNNLVIRLNGTSGATLASEFNNLKLVDSNGNAITNTVTNFTKPGYAVFTFNNPLTLKPNVDQTVTLVGDVRSDALDARVAFNVVGTLPIDASYTDQSSASTVSNGAKVQVDGTNDAVDLTADPYTYSISKGGINVYATYSTKVNLEDNIVAKTQKDVLVGAYKLNNRDSQDKAGNKIYVSSSDGKLTTVATGNKLLHASVEKALITKLSLSQVTDLDSDFAASGVYNGDYPGAEALPANKFSNIRIVDASDHSKVYGQIDYLGTPTLVTLSTPIEIKDNDDTDIAILADINDADPNYYLDIALGGNSADKEIAAQGEFSGINGDVDKTESMDSLKQNDGNVTTDDNRSIPVSTLVDGAGNVPSSYDEVTPGAISTAVAGQGDKLTAQVTVPANISVVADDNITVPTTTSDDKGAALPSGTIISEFTFTDNSIDPVKLTQVKLKDLNKNINLQRASLELVKADNGDQLSAPFKIGTDGTCTVAIKDFAHQDDGVTNNNYKRIDANGTLNIGVKLVSSDDGNDLTGLTAGQQFQLRVDDGGTRYAEMSKDTGHTPYATGTPVYKINNAATAKSIVIVNP